MSHLPCFWVTFLGIFFTSISAKSQHIEQKNGKDTLFSILIKEDLDEKEQEQIELRILDDPDSVLAEAKVLFNSPDIKQHPIAQAHAAWLVGRTYADDPKGEILKIFQEFQKRNFVNAKLYSPQFFQFLIYSYQIFYQQAPLLKLGEKWLDAARSIPDDTQKANALSWVAWFFVENAFGEKFLSSILSEILSLNQAAGLSVTPINAETYRNLSIVFTNLLIIEEEKLIKKQLQEFCDRYQSRWFCASVYYEAGRTKTQHADPAIQKQGFEFFEKSRKLYEALKINNGIAETYFGMTSAHLALGENEKAIETANKALKIYEDLQYWEWQAILLHKLSIAYFNQKKWETSLQFSKKALAICPPSSKRNLQQIHTQLSQIYRQLGDYKNSYDSLSEVLKIQKNHDSFKMNREFKVLRNEAEQKHQEQTKKLLKLTLDAQTQKANADQQARVLLEQRADLQTKSLRQTWVLIAVLFLLTLFVAGTLWLIAENWKRNANMRATRKHLQLILDHLDEGIAWLSVNREFPLQSSRRLSSLCHLQENALNADFFPLLLARSQGNEEQKSMALEGLKSILGEDQLGWDFNRHLLPDILCLHTALGIHYLQLRWFPYVNASGLTEALILVLSDQTEKYSYEHQSERLSSQTQAISRARHIFLHQSAYLLKHILQSYQFMIREMDEGRLDRRELHTLKGNARILELQELSLACHEVETLVQGDGNLQNLAQHLRQAFAPIEGFLQELLIDSIRRPRSLQGLVGPLLANLTALLSKHGLTLESVIIEDACLDWPEDWLESLHEIFLHALTNTVDHGYVRALHAGKIVSPVKILIQANWNQNQRVLRISDQGQGVDWKKLQEIALQRFGKCLDRQDLQQVIFEEGVSTASQLSQTSGRGVGMAAIKEKALGLGAEIELGDNAQGPGSCLQLRWIA